MALFQPGHIPANKGQRSPPRVNRVNAMNSAVQTCRTGGKDPISIQIDVARFLFSLAAKIKEDNPEAFEHPGRPENWPVVERVVRVLEAANDSAHKVSEFAYPKLSRIQHQGDAPSAGTLIENKMVVTLNVLEGGARPPGAPPSGGNGHAGNGHEPPTIEHETEPNGKNGSGSP